MKSFSFIWSDDLEAAIKEAAANLPTLTYHISMRGGEDFDALKAAVNQGIDSHLEAVGPLNQKVETDILGGRWHGDIPTKNLHTLVRRLMEAGNEASDSLASSICTTLEIELI